MEKKFSDTIAEFCNFVADAQAQRGFLEEELTRLDALTQDYLHALELGELSYHERARIATDLANCRKERRKVKDTIEVIDAFVIFEDEKESKAHMNKLRQVLGQVRSAEKKHNNRIYIPKVLKDADGLYGDCGRKEVKRT